jgi:hypothetical protein
MGLSPDVHSGPLFRLASSQPLRRFPERASQTIRAKGGGPWTRPPGGWSVGPSGGVS